MVLRFKARKMNQIDISYSSSIKNGFKLDYILLAFLSFISLSNNSLFSNRERVQ